MRTIRALFITIAGLLLAPLAFLEVWDALQTGVVSVPLGRRRWGMVFTFARQHEWLGFYLGIGLFIAVGALVLFSSMGDDAKTTKGGL